MPIRLNLLAEEQALEEQRRRDPVRRAIVIGVMIVVAALGVSAILLSQQMMQKVELARVVSTLNSHTNEFQHVQQTQKQLMTDHARLAAVVQLTTNRFLYGNLLNALQQADVPGVQVTQIKTEQKYSTYDGTPSTTNSEGHITLGKPATSTEKIVLYVQGKDFSNPPGDSVLKFKDALSRLPYFQAALGKTNEIHLKDRGSPQGAEDGKLFVQFTLECDYPAKTR